MTSQVTNRRRRLDVMPQPYSESPCLHLERVRNREGSSKTAWCEDHCQGGVLWQGVVVEGVKYAPKPPGLYEIAEKAVLHLKVPNKIYSRYVS
jgi:hypothetical protein